MLESYRSTAYLMIEMTSFGMEESLQRRHREFMGSLVVVPTRGGPLSGINFNIVLFLALVPSRMHQAIHPALIRKRWAR